MHYIRFLKPPRLLKGNKPVVKAKVTVTTDLGESFLWDNVDLVVELKARNESIVGKGEVFTWKGSDGMRSLEVDVQVPNSKHQSLRDGLRMLVRPKDDTFSVYALDTLFRKQEDGCIVPVTSWNIQANPEKQSQQGDVVPMAERLFNVEKTRIRIWEETGESIARHIWDAGLLLSSYLSSMSQANAESQSPNTLRELPNLKRTLSKKGRKVIELGSGCGIVGVTLATFYPQISKILLTDLPEATDVLTQNLSPSTLNPQIKSRINHQVLDWASPLPSNAKETGWDLVVVADCTYNPDVVPDLVQTLKRIGEGNEDVVVLLAMKVRHDSEKVFFKLMDEGGFVVTEKCALPLPVLGGEDEEIEIFVFGLK